MEEVDLTGKRSGAHKRGGHSCMHKKNLLLDTFIAIAIAICVMLFMYIYVGYAKYGLSAPLGYSGDGVSSILWAKEVEDTGWIFENHYLGAPERFTGYDFIANFLCNVDTFLIKMIGLVSDNCIRSINMLWILYFGLASGIGYSVLRAMNINQLLSVIGGVLFSSPTYMFVRNTNHITLSAFYFVPLSILVCLWLFEDQEGYLKPARGFFRQPRNILTILILFLIANNGAGYYQFYTCFFLSVTELYTLCIRRNWKHIYKYLIMIFLIIGFAVLAISPALLFQLKYGSNLGITTRGVTAVETFSLKITQLFIPVFFKCIPWVNSMMNIYNSSAPLINENFGSFLSIWGGIGFLLAVVYTLVPFPGFAAVNTGEDGRVLPAQIRLFSVMIISAVLFATVGGFSSLIALVTNFTSMRGNNRISIFILFLSITVLCRTLQNVFHRLNKRSVWRRGLIGSVCALLAVFSFYYQIPGIGYYDAVFEGNLINYHSDQKFVRELEAQLKPGDSVFQLPYHAYPEGGNVNNMPDYQLFIGYIHSEDLKWSHGVMKGRKGDGWNRKTAKLPAEEMVDAILSRGFRGIYIDSRAYLEEDLKTLTGEIERVLQVKGIAQKSQAGKRNKR